MSVLAGAYILLDMCSWLEYAGVTVFVFRWQAARQSAAMWTFQADCSTIEVISCHIEQPQSSHQLKLTAPATHCHSDGGYQKACNLYAKSSHRLVPTW